MTPSAAAVTRVGMGWVLACSLALASCTDEDADPDGGRPGDPRVGDENHAPLARFAATPESGVAPLVVSLDASATSDDRDESGALLYRWDIDGDGTFDTEALAALRVHTLTYPLAGVYVPRLEVTDSEGASATVEASAPITVEVSGEPVANLDVDTNRDGQVTLSDDAGESTWTPARGAITLANVDDDDGDGERDWRDTGFDGANDEADLSPLVIRHLHGLSTEDTVTLRVTPTAAAARVRIFAREGAVRTVVYAPDAQQTTLDRGRVSTADLDLSVETITGRSQQWDGLATLTLEVRRAGVVTTSDVVQLRAAPVIFTDDLQRAEILYVMRIDRDENGENRAFTQALTRDLPAHIQLYDVDEFSYGADRWVQDNMQVGYQSRPVGQTRQVIRTYLETQRPGGLASFVPDEVIDGARGFFFPGGSDTSLNSGGNLEVAPPHTAKGIAYPQGRLIIGGGSAGTLAGQRHEDYMTERQREWLDAQEAQGPAVQVSTEWLAVGHVDEIFLFVPNRAVGAAKPYKVVLASPALARGLLVELAEAGWGNQTVFEGRSTQTTVAWILEDTSFTAYNEAAQARIDSIRAELMDAFDLVDADFVEVPVLYEMHNFEGAYLAAAYNPGMQNLVVADDVLFVPDPEGPVGPSGHDVWKVAATSALAPLGLDVTYVDVFDSYHLLMGEAHCGTNFERQAHDAPWWE